MKVNNKKNEIIEISYKLFIKNGYDNTSVDEIIEKIGIAKGTFYYYFKTKEELLENVINKMIEEEKNNAIQVLDSNISIEEKLIGIIACMRPTSNEVDLALELNKPKNLLMHKKINEKILEVTTPLIADVVNEGNERKIFNCNNVIERVKLILLLSSQIFDNNDYNDNTISVFIDVIEKILGAKKDTMIFIKKLINGGNYEDNN